MKMYLARLREWFTSLAPRERVMVAIGAGAVAATMLYLGAWEPLRKAHEGRAEALVASRVLAQRLEAIAAEAQQARAGGAPAANLGGSLISAVDQAAKSGTLGKAPSRLQPEGDSEVKVWLDSVAFDSLVRWTSELETRYGIHVQTADIERQPTPGVVNARLSLVRT